MSIRSWTGIDIAELPTEIIVAYAVAGSPSQVVVSRGLRKALSDDEFRAVVHHELSHLRRSHDRPLLLTTALQAAFGWLPPVRRSIEHLRLGVERCADEDAAAPPWGPDGLWRALTKLAPREPELIAKDGVDARLAGLTGGTRLGGERRRRVLAAPIVGLSTLAIAGVALWVAASDHGLLGLVRFCPWAGWPDLPSFRGYYNASFVGVADCDLGPETSSLREGDERAPQADVAQLHGRIEELQASAARSMPPTNNHRAELEAAGSETAELADGQGGPGPAGGMTVDRCRRAWGVGEGRAPAWTGRAWTSDRHLGAGETGSSTAGAHGTWSGTPAQAGRPGMAAGRLGQGSSLCRASALVRRRPFAIDTLAVAGSVSAGSGSG